MNPFGDLTGRRILVTGSSTGIGRAIALEAARAGADVILHARASSSAVDGVTAKVRATGRRCDFVAADLSEEASIERLADESWNVWNGLDACVCNAGVDLLTGEAGQLPYGEKLTRLFDVDVSGTVLLAKNLGARMKAAGHGSIVTIGWDQADRGMEGDSAELFSTAKNAIMGFSRSLAVSLAPEVRVNCIAPGWIKTAWGEQASDVWQERVLRETPLKRWGRPDDIAKLCRFLLSDDASYITGQVINANGGAVR